MGKSGTKRRTFIVPKGFLHLFFMKIDEHELTFDLEEVDEEGDLSVNVKYLPEEREAIMDLVELEDEYYEDQEEEEEDEDEDQ